MVLVGAYYLQFATFYGMRMFLFLAGILIASGVVIAVYFAETFSLGSWIGGLALFVFAWIGLYRDERSKNAGNHRHRIPNLTHYPSSP